MSAFSDEQFPKNSMENKSNVSVVKTDSQNGNGFISFFKEIKEKAKTGKIRELVKPPIGKMLIGFAFGFVLGLIGLLLVFLIFHKNPDRSFYVRGALIGWIWWMVIFCLLLL
jgi:hypothetical protein